MRPLADNISGEKYYYQISVYTGMRRGAGTKSTVYFVLSGEHGDTGVRILCDDKIKVKYWDFSFKCDPEM